MVDQAIEDFKFALEPSTETDIVMHLMGMWQMLRKPKDMQDNCEQIIDLMVPFVSDYPIDIFADACKAHIERSPFFPSVADLMPHLKNGLAKRKMMFDRLLQLQRVAANPAPQGMITHGWRLQIMTGRPPRNRASTEQYLPKPENLTRPPQQAHPKKEEKLNDTLAKITKKTIKSATRQAKTQAANQG